MERTGGFQTRGEPDPIYSLSPTLLNLALGADHSYTSFFFFFFIFFCSWVSLENDEPNLFFFFFFFPPLKKIKRNSGKENVKFEPQKMQVPIRYHSNPSGFFKWVH